MAAMAFWFFLAAIVIAEALKKISNERLKHQTLRLLIEKNQKLDEAQLKEILNPTPPPQPLSPPGVNQHTGLKQGDGYRGQRVGGTILMSIGLGLIIACLCRGMILGFHDTSLLDWGTWSALLSMMGIGFFVSSRFLTQPLDEAQLKELRNQAMPPPPEWRSPQGLKQGDGYRGQRVAGTILLSIALGLIIACLWRGMILGFNDKSLLDWGGFAIAVSMLGIGFFVSSRFLARPIDENKGKKGL